MNRVFHARIAWYQYFLLVVLGANAFGFLWCKYILLAAFMMLLLIVVIEQVIHTVTSQGELILSDGRFTRKKTFALKDMISVQKHHSMKFGRFSVTEYVLIEYGKDKFVSVMPVKEREFMEWLEKIKNNG